MHLKEISLFQFLGLSENLVSAFTKLKSQLVFYEDIFVTGLNVSSSSLFIFMVYFYLLYNNNHVLA